MPIDPEVRKQLDAVVGERYAPPRRWKATAAKWAVAALLAIATSAVVISILDVHASKAQSEAARKRPVPITIIPAK